MLLSKTEFGSNQQIAHQNLPRDNGNVFSFFRKWKAKKNQIGSEQRSIHAKVNEREEKILRSISPPNSYMEGSSSAMANTKGIDKCQRNALLVYENLLDGRIDTKNKLVDWVKDGDTNLRILSIFGIAGIGKTTMAKLIYQDIYVTSLFKKCAFVTISQPFKEYEVLKDIMKQLFPDEIRMQLLPVDRLKKRMKERLQNERYFVVLDDVMEEDDWGKLQPAFSTNNKWGSKVVFTTPVRKVASSCSDKFYILEPLSEGNSWILFCKKTFGGKSCPSNLEHICQQILQKYCDGIPQAILLIGGLLATKDVNNRAVWVEKATSLDSLPEEYRVPGAIFF